MALHSQAALDALFDRCAADADCQAAFPDLRRRFEAVLDRLENAPAALTFDHPRTGNPTEVVVDHWMLAGIVRLLVYSPQSASLLPVLIDAAFAGDYRAVATYALMVSESMEDLAVGLNYAVLCTEDIPFVTDVDLDALNDTYMGSAFLEVTTRVCEHWPRGILDDNLRDLVASDTPVLLLSGETRPHHTTGLCTPGSCPAGQRRGGRRARPGPRHVDGGLQPAPDGGIRGPGGSGLARPRLRGSHAAVSAVHLAHGARAVIEVRDLAKRFGKVQALRGVSFTAHDGQITGFLGPNGAGKSTTLRIPRHRPCGGCGHGPGERHRCPARPHVGARRIGVLPHNSNLYPNLTARENIAYYAGLQGLGGAVLEAAVDRMIARLEIGPFAGRRAKGFSQGQRIRVALARAMVHDPDTLILDEPTNGLDVMATRVLREVIRERRDAGCCVLFSSHIMQDVALLCDRIAIVAAGTVAVAGTADDIRAATGCDDLEDAFVKVVDVPGSEAG